MNVNKAGLEGEGNFDFKGQVNKKYLEILGKYSKASGKIIMWP